MKRDISVPYVEFSVQLYGCVENIDSFKKEIKSILVNKLWPDAESDIIIELVTTAEELPR